MDPAAMRRKRERRQGEECRTAGSVEGNMQAISHRYAGRDKAGVDPVRFEFPRQQPGGKQGVQCSGPQSADGAVLVQDKLKDGPHNLSIRTFY
jgi:hypothetical protein